jgi:hypothetical protein
MGLPGIAIGPDSPNEFTFAPTGIPVSKPLL